MDSVKITKQKLLNTYKCKKGEETHYFMDGGRLHIPREKIINVYSCLEQNKINPPLVEKVSAYGEYFKFFIDYDDQIDQLLKPEDVAMAVVNASKKLFIFDDDKADKYTIYKNSKKEKYHLVFQFLTNKRQAQDINELILNDVPNYISDTSVYNSNLRLPLCIKGKDDTGIYEFYSGYEGSIFETASVLNTEGLQVARLTEEYEEYNKQEEKEEKQVDDTNKLNDILNKIYKWDEVWSYEKQGKENYKILCDGYQCLVEPDHKHTSKNHSCLFISAKGVTATCYSEAHTTQMLPRKKFKKLFEFLDISTIKENKTKISGLTNYQDEIFPEQTIEYFDENLDTTHDDVAKNFYFMYSGLYVCAQEKPTVLWYRCSKGKWERMDGVSSIRKEMASKFLNCYKFLAKAYVDSVDVGKDDRMDFLKKYTDTQILERASTCYEIIQKLKTKGYTDALIIQAIGYFKIEKFIEKLDVNPELLCFGENLYDLDKCEWRETRPTDMCSLQCGVSMDEIENVTEQQMIEFYEMLISVFPLEERREYFKNRLSDFLYGKNTKEIFDIWTGTGGNGKGLLSTILKGAFGEYFYTGNVAGITAKKRVSSNAADPDVANFRGKRIIQFTEPSQGARLNNAIMKGYTGNDTMKARELYGAPIEFEPTFTPYIECNSFSLQDIQDDSIPRRLNFVKFRMKFVDADKVVNKSQAPRDDTLKTEEKMKLFKVCMMKMLLETWEGLTKKHGSVVHKFKVPETNLQDKEEFLAENDEVKQFITERIEVTNNENDILTCKDIYEEYKELLKEERTGFKIKKGDFARRLKNCLPVEYRERHQPRFDGKKMNYRQCFLNVKWKEEELEYDL